MPLASTGTPIRKSAGPSTWLLSIQNEDGGWGEDGESYKLDYHGLRAGAEHGVTDELGAPRLAGSRRNRSSCRGAGHRLCGAADNSRMVFGKRKDIQPPVFLGFFICVTMAIRNSFRYGLWHAIEAEGRQSQVGARGDLTSGARFDRHHRACRRGSHRRGSRHSDARRRRPRQTPGSRPRGAVAQGGRSILSFGIAGGLAPKLRPGTWLIARSVIDGASRIRHRSGLVGAPGRTHSRC